MRLTPYAIDHPLPIYQIRATYDENVIRVYQAYSDEMADTALAAGTFVSPPRPMRMTGSRASRT